jgi:DNA-binding XRE family transcriptional regulator
MRACCVLKRPSSCTGPFTCPLCGATTSALDSTEPRRLMSRLELMGVAVRVLRQAKKWTRADLAARLGVVEKTIADYENGAYLPGKDRLATLVSLGLEPPRRHVPRLTTRPEGCRG